MHSLPSLRTFSPPSALPARGLTAVPARGTAPQGPPRTSHTPPKRKKWRRSERAARAARSASRPDACHAEHATGGRADPPGASPSAAVHRTTTGATARHPVRRNHRFVGREQDGGPGTACLKANRDATGEASRQIRTRAGTQTGTASACPVLRTREERQPRWARCRAGGPTPWNATGPDRLEDPR